MSTCCIDVCCSLIWCDEFVHILFHICVFTFLELCECVLRETGEHRCIFSLFPCYIMFFVSMLCKKWYICIHWMICRTKLQGRLQISSCTDLTKVSNIYEVYVAPTPLVENMSKCPTCVGVWHWYNLFSYSLEPQLYPNRTPICFSLVTLLFICVCFCFLSFFSSL